MIASDFGALSKKTNLDTKYKNYPLQVESVTLKESLSAANKNNLLVFLFTLLHA